MAEYLPQDSDYYDILRTKLGDLQGADTLIHELTQNAHDAYRDAERTKHASRIAFDIRDDGLTVTNDGIFSSCGRVGAPECAWVKADPDHELCDFHRFQKVAGGDKSKADNVVGAFGVGFISVYQVTDRPELWSNGLHWTLDPTEVTARRIFSEADDENRAGTTFWLPWASEAGSKLGTLLNRAPTPIAEHIRAMEEQGPDVAERAIMFLKNMEHVEILRNGRRLSLITKTEADDELIIDRDGTTHSWMVVQGDFSRHKREANALLAGQLAKRSSQVTVAIPDDPSGLAGLLFCGLPTRQASQLPFHIDAHFFPSSDRKRIDIEGRSYQVDWNMAALTAAARALTESLESIGRTLGHATLWSMLSKIYAQAHRTELQEVFWKPLQDCAPDMDILLTSTGNWRAPSQSAFLLGQDEEANLPAMEALQLELAHPELRPYQTTMGALGARKLDTERLVAAIREVAGDRIVRVSDASPVLSSDELRLQLGDELGKRFNEEKGSRAELALESLKELPICVTLTDRLAAPNRLIGVPTEGEIAALVDVGIEALLPAWDQRNARFIRSLLPRDWVLKASEYVIALVKKSPNDSDAILARFFEWMHRGHLADVYESSELRERLTDGNIWPTADGLHCLNDICVPGGFTDSLGLARSLDTAFASGIGELAEVLGCDQLDVVAYAKRYVPALFEDGRPSVEVVTQLLEDLASCPLELTASDDARVALSELELAPCSDGRLRRPRDVVFDSANVRALLGEDAPRCIPSNSAVRTLLEWLGASGTVSVPAILSRIREVSKRDANLVNKGAARSALRALAGLNVLNPIPEADIDELRSMAWLPATDDEAWHKPTELLTAFQREVLFGRHGLQLDYPLKGQREASSLLRALGCRNDPTPGEAIDYLEELLAANRSVPIELFKLLDRSVTSRAAERLAQLPLFEGSNGRRYGSDRAFTGPHPFGDWAVTLEGEWGALPALLKALGIKREPDALDAARVLAYIDYESSEFHEPVDFRTHAAVNACWSLIGSCEDDEQLAEIRSDIERRRTALNADDVLVPPDELFFNDQPALAAYLEDVLGASLVSRVGDAWRGLAKCGTTNISEAITVEIQNAEDSRDTTAEFREGIESRRAPILRAMAQDDRLESPDALVENWLKLSCQAAGRVGARLTMTRPHIDVPVDAVRGALLDRSEGVLYVIDGDAYPFAAVARELLTGANVEAGHLPLLITALEQVLAAADASEAEEALDVRGFARFEATRAPIPGAECDLPAEEGEDQESVSGDEGKTSSEDETVLKQVPDRKRGDAPERSRRPQRRDERLRSYVICADDSDTGEGASGRSADRNIEIGNAGVQRVLAYEKSKRRSAQQMTHLNKGYDVKSEDEFGNVRFIEVKSTTELWGRDGVGITPAQHDYARRNADEWWLYVVEAAESDDHYAIYCINNFVERTYRYMFDDGWRTAAKERAGHWKDNENSVKRAGADLVLD